MRLRIVLVSMGLVLAGGLASCSSDGAKDSSTTLETTSTTTLTTSTTGASSTTTTTAEESPTSISGVFEVLTGDCGQLRTSDGTVYELMMDSTSPFQLVNADGELKFYDTEAALVATAGASLTLTGEVTPFDPTGVCPDATAVWAFVTVTT